MDRDNDYRRSYDQGRRGWDRGRETGTESGRNTGYNYGRGGYDFGREGYDLGRDREREEFMLQRREHSGAGERDWGRESGYARGGSYERYEFGPGEQGRGDYGRRGEVGDYGRGSGPRRDEEEQYGYQRGEGELMYRPDLMPTSSHSDSEYERRARGPMSERRGYWGQGGVGGEFGTGSGRGRETDWERGYGPQARERQAWQGEVYREGGLTREGRQIAARQTGPFTGRGPRGYRRSDDRIQEDVCETLSRHGEIDASEVEVRVQDGEVTLTGTVEDRRQKRMIEDVIEEISGVKDVNNQLRVQQRSGQQGTWGGDDLARTGQTTTGATIASSTGASAGPGGEAERAGTNARTESRAR